MKGRSLVVCTRRPPGVRTGTNLAIDEIRKIKIALSKIEDGTYGICRVCDERISPKRLEVLPYATRCIDCATAEQA